MFQVPIPEPLRFLEPRETETRRMHALEEYGLMHVKLYEDISRHGQISTSYAYPVKVDGRYVLDPSPTPKFDNPKMDNCPALQLFSGPGQAHLRDSALHQVVSLDFEDHPFDQMVPGTCALCGETESFLDEIITDDRGGRMFVCSDTHHCETRRASAQAVSEAVIPGRCEAPNPESSSHAQKMDSGFRPAAGPGMTGK